MRSELTGLSILLVVFIAQWVYPLVAGFDDRRAPLLFPVGVMGTLLIPMVMRDVVRARRRDVE